MSGAVQLQLKRIAHPGAVVAALRDGCVCTLQHACDVRRKHLVALHVSQLAKRLRSWF
jgi:hypothetical protein